MHSPSRAPLLQLLLPLAGGLLALAACEDGPTTPRVATLDLTAGSAYLDVGQLLDLQVRGEDRSGQPLPSLALELRSGDPAIAQVGGMKVLGRAPGEVWIHASIGGVADSVKLTVETPVAELEVGPDTLHLVQGRGARLFVEMRDAAGKPMAHSLSFASAATGVATVDEAGEVRTVATGSTDVTVTAGQKTVKVPVRVGSGSRYAVRPLVGLQSDSSAALGLNERGDVVGSMKTAGGAVHPFLWRLGRATDLGVAAGYARAFAVAVNDSGMVVGTAERPSRQHYSPALESTAWTWEKGTLSPVAVDFPRAEAKDVNDRGQVVLSGWYAMQGGGTHYIGQAWIWAGGSATQLTTPDGLTSASAVNDRGVVGVTGYDAGYAYTGATAGFLWEGGQLARLAEGMYVADLNDQGHAAGSCSTGSIAVRQYAGCLWDGGKVVMLPTLTRAFSINRHGDVLGESQSGPVLVRDGQAHPLNTLAPSAEWEIVAASRINDLGWIAATGKHRATGKRAALLLVPAP